MQRHLHRGGVGDLSVGTGVEQNRDDLFVLLGARGQEWRGAVLVLDVDLDVGRLAEYTHDGCVAMVGRQMERAREVDRRGIDIGAVRDEELCELGTHGRRRRDRHRGARSMDRMDLGELGGLGHLSTSVDQHSNDGDASCIARFVQRRSDIGVGRGVDVRLEVEQ